MQFCCTLCVGTMLPWRCARLRYPETGACPPWALQLTLVVCVYRPVSWFTREGQHTELDTAKLRSHRPSFAMSLCSAGM